MNSALIASQPNAPTRVAGISSGSPANNSHLKALDGLRAIAVMMVFFMHARAFLPLAWKTATESPLSMLAFVSLVIGPAGVDIFFVISGFLITGILLKAKGSLNYFSVFYARRSLRIFPLYYAAVMLTFLIPLLRHRITAPLLTQIWYWLNFSNLPTSVDLARVPYLSHFWSLAIEEQFYLLWPLLVYKLRPTRLLIIALAAVPGELALRFLSPLQSINSRHAEFLYRFTPTHSEGLFAGAAVAILIYLGHIDLRHVARLKAAAWISAFLTALTYVLGARFASLMNVRFTVLAIWFALSIAVLALQKEPGWIARCLASWPLRKIGRYSFFIYVFQIPILISAQTRFFSRVHHNVLLDAEYIFTFTLIVFAGALSSKYFEEPILALKRKYLYRFPN